MAAIPRCNFTLTPLTVGGGFASDTALGGYNIARLDYDNTLS